MTNLKVPKPQNSIIDMIKNQIQNTNNKVPNNLRENYDNELKHLTEDIEYLEIQLKIKLIRKLIFLTKKMMVKVSGKRY